MVSIVYGSKWLKKENMRRQEKDYHSKMHRNIENFDIDGTKGYDPATGYWDITLSIIIIVIGVISLIDGFVVIVGTAKRNKPLLVIHLVMLGLTVIGHIYVFFVAFSIPALIGFPIAVFRICVASRLIQLLRMNSPVSNCSGDIQPLNVAPQHLAFQQIEDDGLPTYDSLFGPSALGTIGHHSSLSVPSSTRHYHKTPLCTYPL
ncbi:hypothetical protein CHUAL_001289 [Chamberlinius hualienensis]